MSVGQDQLGRAEFYEHPATIGFIQPAKKAKFMTGSEKGLTSSCTKGPRHSLSQEGVTFHQEPDLGWSKREVKLPCGSEQIT